MNRFLAAIAVFSACSASFGAHLHDAVRKLDFRSAEAYFNNGGDPNIVDEVTGKTALEIAIEQAFPKSFELKNYPFDKQTFLFMKKAVNCGLTTGVKRITQHLVYDNPQGDVVFQALQGNKADTLSANCNAEGECEKTAETEKSPEPSCLSQEEIGAFIAQVRHDAPNCVTSVTDVLAAFNDFLFDRILFYEAAQPDSAELNMIKLLISNKATLLPETAAKIMKAADAAEDSAITMFKQSAVRLFGNACLFTLSNMAQSGLASYRIASQASMRYPANAVSFMIGVKSIIDLRNMVSAFAYSGTLKPDFNKVRVAATTSPEAQSKK